MALFEFETNGTLEPWVDREWLLTDGTGSFAMGTVSGVATRKYHSMLVAATKPPVGRISTVARVGEILLIDGHEELHELSACRFTGGNVHPKGFKHLKKFSLEEDEGEGERAVWVYEVNGITVTKTLRLIPNSTTAELTYDVRVEGGKWVELLLLPMVALRDFHSVRRHQGWNMGVQQTSPREVRVDADGQAVRLSASTGTFESDPDWWFGHVYSIETERGQGDTEDLFKPGVFRATFSSPGSITLRISPDPVPAALGAKFGPAKVPAGASKSMKRLMAGSKAFLIRRRTPTGTGTSVVAGFPWFADWGRDTFISLPGLLLETGRLTEAAEVLRVFAAYVSEGMIPNKFDDYSNEPHYNTVDASLWFIHGAHEYVAKGGSKELFEKELLPACREIVKGYRDGTRFHIKMDAADGMIYQGDENTQLTWMDARYENVSFTPRQGKAVEINALWYHALVLLGERELAGKVKENFGRTFWNSPFRGLYDVVDGSKKDGAIRPNQIFAVSLPNSALTLEQQKAVVEVVKRELLTPVGLRTLAASDPGYKGKYGGPQSERDAAYHNGTVWPWPIGGFFDAYLRVHGDTKETREEIRGMMAPLLRHLEEGCIGQIAEIFQADAPFKEVGACAQAWSLAEVLRIAAKVGV